MGAQVIYRATLTVDISTDGRLPDDQRAALLEEVMGSIGSIFLADEDGYLAECDGIEGNIEELEAE